MKLQEYFHSDDDLLRGISFQDLIDTVYSNESIVDERSVRKVYKEILTTNLKDAEYELKQNMTEVIANDFATAYPHFWFKAYPWSTLGMVDYRMVIDVTQLDITMGKSIILSANWTLLNEKTHVVIAHDNVVLEQVLVEDNYAHVVKAMNQLLAQFAQEVHFSQNFPF